MLPLPLQFVLVMLAGWVNRQQQEVIAYLHAENHVLREQLGGRGPSGSRTLSDPGWRGPRIGSAVDGSVRSGRSSRLTRCFAGTGSSSLGSTTAARSGDPAGPEPLGRFKGWSSKWLVTTRVGLHAHPGCSRELGIQRGPEHDQADPA